MNEESAGWLYDPRKDIFAQDEDMGRPRELLETVENGQVKCLKRESMSDL
jgi:hypothetical protein